MPPRLLIFLIGGALGLGLTATFIYTYIDRGNQIKELVSWQTSVIDATTKAVVKTGKDGKQERLNPQDIVPAIETLKFNYDQCSTTLDGIDRDALDYGVRSDSADERLKEQLRQAQQHMRRAQNRIADLEKRVGDADATCEERLKAISDDSNAAWEGWSQ